MTPNKTRKTTKRKSNKTLMLAIGIIAIVIIGIGAYAMLGQSSNQPDTTPTPTPTPTQTPTTSPTPNGEVDAEYVGATKVLLQTNMGDIIIALRNDMPITTGNFKNLVEQGTYNGTIFHRVIYGFMLQQ